MKIYCDGSGFNGMKAGYTVLPEGKAPINYETKEPCTVNEMEYEAVIQGLMLAGPEDEVFTDSRLVVEQTKGNWAVKVKSLLPFAEKANSLLQEKKCKLTWIPRNQNKAGLIRENKTYMPKVG